MSTEIKPKNTYAFAFANDFEIQEGMTLRDYFANSAMLGCLSSPLLSTKDMNEIAKTSYQLADAMLKQREL